MRLYGFLEPAQMEFRKINVRTANVKTLIGWHEQAFSHTQKVECPLFFPDRSHGRLRSGQRIPLTT
jgi:hypothetical protein